METIDFSYSYYESDETRLEQYLSSLENELGGTRNPLVVRAGAIDLVTILEVVVSFIATAALQPILEKYFEGLFNADAIKGLGEHHREQILIWLNKLRSEIETSLKAMKFLSDIHVKSNSLGNEEAVALIINIGHIPLFIVLNHNVITPNLLLSLPQGIVNAIKYIAENQLPEDSHVLQLYFDRFSEKWLYLLAPTTHAFGRYIDQYVDLDNGLVIKIESRKKFLEKFRPDTKDEFKFLVNPFHNALE